MQFQKFTKVAVGLTRGSREGPPLSEAINFKSNKLFDLAGWTKMAFGARPISNDVFPAESKWKY